MFRNNHLFSLFFLFLFFASVSLVTSREIDIGNVIAYPNPYNPSTSSTPIQIKRAGSGGNPPSDLAGEVTVTIYDASLKEVDRRQFGTGADTTWFGVDKLGQRVPPGLYYIHVIESRSDGSTGSKFVKMIIQ